MLTGDFSPPPAVLAQVVRDNTKKDQLTLFPGGSARYVNMNNTIKPFDDINVRKAVIAGFDREAMRLVRGGELVGDIPTHMIPPGLPGFEEAGGLKGPGLDFMSHPEGDAALAAEYFKKAGYASGKYEGDRRAADGRHVRGRRARRRPRSRRRTSRRWASRSVCGSSRRTRCTRASATCRRANVAICPNVSWGKDFADAQTILDPTFNGKNIVPQGNSNWPELDDPEINEAMDEAALISDPKERAEAWAKIDLMVTEQAPLVAWIWDKQALLRSADTNGAVERVQLDVGPVVDVAEVSWSRRPRRGELEVQLRSRPRAAASSPRRRRRASPPPGGRSPGRGRSRGAGGRRPSGRSGRTRTGGRPSSMPGPSSRTTTSPSATVDVRPSRRAGSTCARCRAGS